jgi:hypothetical protein
MDILEAIENLILSITQPGGFYDLLGVLVFILELLYLAFAFIIIRQVSLMTSSLNSGYVVLFTFVAFVHFFATLGLVLLSLLVLF